MKKEVENEEICVSGFTTNISKQGLDCIGNRSYIFMIYKMDS